MTRVGRWAAASLCAALLPLAGCTSSGTTDTPSAAGTTDGPAPTPASPATSPTGPPTSTAPSSTDAPSAGSMDEPATSSGPLSRRSFPTPKRLGPGWRYAVDPGDAEEGYSGNGTPALARRPEEIVQTAVPFGCDRSTPLTPPRHALEVDYTFAGRRVVAVRGKFADVAAATTFFTGRAADLRGLCRPLGKPGHRTARDRRRASRPADALSSTRTPRSDPYRELAVLDRDTVVLLAVQGGDALSPARPADSWRPSARDPAPLLASHGATAGWPSRRSCCRWQPWARAASPWPTTPTRRRRPRRPPR